MEVEQVLEMMHIIEIIKVTILYTENIYAILQRAAKYNQSSFTRVSNENP
jgi:hypothetical protein